MLEFSLNLKTKPVKLNGEEFQLREMTGAQRDKYLTDMQGRVEFRDGNTTTVTKVEGLQAGIISLCLFDLENYPVSVETIQQYPASVIQELFRETMEINGMNITPDEAKNG